MGCVDRQWSALLASSVTSFLVVVVVLVVVCCCCLPCSVSSDALFPFFTSAPAWAANCCCCCCCWWDCDAMMWVDCNAFSLLFILLSMFFLCFIHCYAVVTPRRNVMRKRPLLLRRVNVTQHRIRWRFHFRLYFGIESYKHLLISLSWRNVNVSALSRNPNSRFHNWLPVFSLV